MNLDSHKFFIGLMDFFSILLPGALLTFLLMAEVGPVVLGDGYAKLPGAEAWAAFRFASYLFGQRVFLLGFDKLIILDQVGARWHTIGADYGARDTVRQLKRADILEIVMRAAVLARNERPIADANRTHPLRPTP